MEAGRIRWLPTLVEQAALSQQNKSSLISLLMLSPLHLSKEAAANQLTHIWGSSACTAATVFTGAAHQLQGVCQRPFAPEK